MIITSQIYVFHLLINNRYILITKKLPQTHLQSVVSIIRTDETDAVSNFVISPDPSDIFCLCLSPPQFGRIILIDYHWLEWDSLNTNVMCLQFIGISWLSRELILHSNYRFLIRILLILK